MLPKKWLNKIYNQKLFKLFIPKKFGGLQLSFSEGLQQMFNAATFNGSYGWCINLGAGAGYFCGCFEEQTAEKIFRADNAVIAGSGSVNAKAVYTNYGFILDGYWQKCSGALHATTFTVNASLPDESICSFALNPKDVLLIKENSMFGLKATSSFAIEAKQVFVPNEFSFQIGKLKSFTDYQVYHIPFDVFARFCMAATYLGIVQCFLNHTTEFLNEKKLMEPLLYEEIQESLKNYLETLLFKAENATLINQKEKIDFENFINTSTNYFYNNCNILARHIGMPTFDETKIIHWAWRDVVMASQHFLLK
ncbi:MAG: hypothetical protein ACK4K9_09740 [Bacteroidia bacterium]